ncbi:hypothetical protein CPB86DRAFT_803161 [Serendipita vermifera]|nr:hypothetical protein CPB86DRAFT_803161 [Serendipita vermifera]
MPPKAFWTKFTSLVQKPLGDPETGFLKPIITLKDTTVEWPKPVDCPLTREVDYLWLEVRSNGRVVDRIPVFAVESCPGVWSAEGRLVRPKTSAEFMIFVYMTVYETKRRLLGFVKLNGPDFYEGLDKVHEYWDKRAFKASFRVLSGTIRTKMQESPSR